MKRISFILLILSAQFINAAQTSPSSSTTPAEFQSEKEILEKSLFPKKDSIVETPTCEFSCRAVSEGYKTQITNIDVPSGTNYCRYFGKK